MVGDEFRNMHSEAQLAEAGMKKGNDWRAGCYKLDYSSQTHTKIPLSLHTHTHTSAVRISSRCAVSYPPPSPGGILSALSLLSGKCV